MTPAAGGSGGAAAAQRSLLPSPESLPCEWRVSLQQPVSCPLRPRAPGCDSVIVFLSLSLQQRDVDSKASSLLSTSSSKSQGFVVQVCFYSFTHSLAGSLTHSFHRYLWRVCCVSDQL